MNNDAGVRGGARVVVGLVVAAVFLSVPCPGAAETAPAARDPATAPAPTTRPFDPLRAVATVPPNEGPPAVHAFSRPDSIPRLVHKIEFGDYGAKYIRLGDLDGDGRIDVLVVQAKGSAEDQERPAITCLTAVNLDGKVLWQVGKPDRANTYFGSDFCVQIYDHDGDGKNGVLYIPDDKKVLTILDGATGAMRREAQLAGGINAMLFADFAGAGWPRDLLVKDVYNNFWVYDKDFKLAWQKVNCNAGHYPAVYDLDGDGRDELLAGYTLYSHDGKELWSHPEFYLHNDATYIDDVDGDGKAEIAIATSVDGVLLDRNGKILFRQPMIHAQHALIGKFRKDLPGKQVFFFDRLAHTVQRTPRGEASMYTAKGEQLWKNRDNFWWTGGMVVDNWTGDPNEQFVCLYSRGWHPPGLVDGHGREIATFPFPPAEIHDKAAAIRYHDYYCQHVSCYGDEREEILVFNERALYVYANAAVWQKPRLYNNTYYPGRL